MRIAILADPIDNQKAGVHVFTREMTDALIRNNPGHEIILVREKRDANLIGAQQLVIPNTMLPVGFASLRLFLLVPLLLRLKGVDVVIEPAHFGPFNLPRKVKRITIIHDLTPLLFPQYHRWHSRILQKIFLRRILRRAHHIIANSNHTANDICMTFPGVCSKVKRIYPGVRKNFGPEPEYDVLEKYRITRPYFLFVGTIEPRKGLITLLEAFHLFCTKTASDALLVIAGGRGWKAGSFYVELENHPFRNRIILTGYVPDHELPSLYKEALALLYPSEYEGFGFPVAEAMHFGSPVIVAANSSLAEVGGDAALYYQTGNVQQLFEKMADVHSDPKIRQNLLPLACKQSARFNWDEFAKVLFNTLSE